ncbi:hypothetical protein M404DRAFT_806050 [Pisolithus tinctorius Marx 270]|uniref:Uncharacterized protein n=1 Tax=Pisolithus tinctorius Marx 270 TaxID=870435 RepID=A0A0C3PDT8_PISTI|nr:hypothetical protein M404DRAFT_806050 [Pisolithus tinctorius Marx 270]
MRSSGKQYLFTGATDVHITKLSMRHLPSGMFAIRSVKRKRRNLAENDTRKWYVELERSIQKIKGPLFFSHQPEQGMQAKTWYSTGAYVDLVPIFQLLYC